LEESARASPIPKPLIENEATLGTVNALPTISLLRNERLVSSRLCSTFSGRPASILDLPCRFSDSIERRLILATAI